MMKQSWYCASGLKSFGNRVGVVLVGVLYHQPVADGIEQAFKVLSAQWPPVLEKHMASVRLRQVEQIADIKGLEYPVAPVGVLSFVEVVIAL
jgi:hypothetical protein